MAQSLEELLKVQLEKLEQLSVATTFIQNRDHVSEELKTVFMEVSSLKNALNLARSDLEEMKKKNVALQDLSTMLEKLKHELSHMENNVPPKLLDDYANVLKESQNSTKVKKNKTPKYNNSTSVYLDDTFQEDETNNVENCKKILFDEPEIYPRIKLISQSEFEVIPKYMIGRQPLEALNQFLSTINDILKAKYSLLALDKNEAKKKGEFDLYMNYKKQENENDKDKGKFYFFTADDYSRQTKSKLDKTRLNLLTVLRHCKRLREVRTSKAIHYVVVTL